MPREVHPNLQALIDSGHCNQHSAIDVILKDGTTFYLSTGELLVGIKQYKADIDDIGEFSMSLDPEVDEIEFDVQNIDYLMGRTLTGFDTPLAGAEGILGIIFINPTTLAIFYDAKMKGEIITGEVSDTVVEFQLASKPDVVYVSGRAIASEFPWREPVHVVPSFNPNDLPGRPDPEDPEGPRRFPGRYGDYGDLMPIMPVMSAL